MAEYGHAFGWNGCCEYCGVTEEAIEDHIASPNCDIVRSRNAGRLAAVVSFGVMVCCILFAGMWLN